MSIQGLIPRFSRRSGHRREWVCVLHDGGVFEATQPNKKCIKRSLYKAPN